MIQEKIISIAQNAKKAAHELVKLDSSAKNDILKSMADELDLRRESLKIANQKDLIEGREHGLSSAMLDRLELNDKRFDVMIEGISDIIQLPDPVGQIIDTKIRPNGLQIEKVRVPIGVIGIIYESRPNVTADAATLCLKSSNAVILRGGSESINSNLAIASALDKGGKKRGLPDGSVQLVPSTDREAVRHLVQLEGKIDLIIPRGGESLIRAVTEMSRIPVLKHYKGVCHIFVDKTAKQEMAIEICENAKCQRPGVCNALETLLIHRDIAADFLPALNQRLQSHGVEIRGDDETNKILTNSVSATENDWYEEYLDLILSVKVVTDIDEAIKHINKYGSQHSDAIITNSEQNMSLFRQQVDSATVYVNASTRFTDGAEFGMGAEMGISTDKLHARGPVGLEELTTYKYLISGTGHIRS